MKKKSRLIISILFIISMLASGVTGCSSKKSSSGKKTNTEVQSSVSDEKENKSASSEKQDEKDKKTDSDVKQSNQPNLPAAPSNTNASVVKVSSPSPAPSPTPAPSPAPVPSPVPKALTSPKVTAYTENSTKDGAAINISFTDDSKWRNLISKIVVNGNEINSSKYSIEAGKITIKNGSVFSDVNSIIIKANGYIDATVTQDSISAKNPAVKTILITKMMCDGCVQDVYHKLSEIDGVKVEEVTIGEALVTLTKNVSDSVFINTLSNREVTKVITVTKNTETFNGILGQANESGNPAKFVIQSAQNNYGIEILENGKYKFYEFDENGQNIAATIAKTSIKLNAKNSNITLKVSGIIDNSVIKVTSIFYTLNLNAPVLSAKLSGSDIIITFNDNPAWRGVLEGVLDNNKILSKAEKQFNIEPGKITIYNGAYSSIADVFTVTTLGYNTASVVLPKYTTKTITISGMMCQGCIDYVTNALKNIDGVSIVSVEVGKAVVNVTDKVNNDALKNAIEKNESGGATGYTVTSIK